MKKIMYLVILGLDPRIQPPLPHHLIPAGVYPVQRYGAGMTVLFKWGA
jgi:hypothetical protein